MKIYAHFEDYKYLKLRSKSNFIKFCSINAVEKSYSEDYYLNNLSYKLQKIQNNLNSGLKKTINWYIENHKWLETNKLYSYKRLGLI